MLAVGQKFCHQKVLTQEAISAFAREAGDMNPLHHDPAYAATTRYTRVVACGGQYSALFLGLAAQELSGYGHPLSTEASFSFLRPVLANDTLTITWEIVDVLQTGLYGGPVGSISGKINNQLGKVPMTATT